MVTKTKYNGTGLFKSSSLQDKNLPKEIEDVLVTTVNHAVSMNTKSVYNTGVNILNKCREEMGEEMNLPLSERDILIFVGFCAKRGNKTSTIRSYLSGIKKYHLAEGYRTFEYMTPLVKEVLEGHEKKGKVKTKGSKGKKVKRLKRLPCTLPVLKLIKFELKLSNLDKDEKIMAWAASSLAFFGAFRMSELLCKNEYEYSTCDNLLKKDVKVCKPDSTGKESVSIRIRNGKTSKGAEELVTVYATYDACCPVSAVKKLQVLNKDLPNDAPAFCSKQGKNFTCKRLNVILELLTSDHFDSGKISNHSFRAGLISYFARLGHSEIDLKTIGRWSSRAYQHYIKLGRAKRHEMTVAASNIKS